MARHSASRRGCSTRDACSRWATAPDSISPRSTPIWPPACASASVPCAWDDARAALAWLEARAPHARRWVAGFSFGAWIAARLAASAPGVERMILVAPGVTTSSFEVLRTSQVPKLVVQGTADEVCRLEALRPEF